MLNRSPNLQGLFRAFRYRNYHLFSKNKMTSAAATSSSKNFSSTEHHHQPVAGFQYQNVLRDLKSRGDIRYALLDRKFPAYKHSKPRTPQQIVQDTFDSEAVRSAIEQAMRDKNWSKPRAEEEARKILAEMAQAFDMKAVRALAYPAKKILQSLYSGIFVNEDAIPRIKALCVDNPVLFMPSHRTYMDFILLQFLCYHYELPLPAIASAVDFLQMHFMSQMLRRCGAYFIRRSFNDDPFYRAIFSEYVRTQLSNGDRTMEAFVEGSRSRTGKSLSPKYGFLSTIVEPYLKSEVFDIMIVPVSINYSKIIEETLYAYEMLGYSKPKESTSALFKARRILGTNYGEIHVTFAEPLSVREFLASLPTPVDRSVYNVPPAGIFQMNENEQKAVKHLAHRIVKIQERHSVVGLWSLMCFFINQFLAYSPKVATDQAICFNDLCRKVALAHNLAARLGYSVYRCKDTLAEDLTEQVELHKNLATLDTATHTLRMNLVSSIAVDLSRCTNDSMYKWADVGVPRVILANYANQCYHWFADAAYLAVHFGRDNAERPVETVRRDFTFLQRLFSHEFIVDTLTEDQSFNRILDKCQSANVFEVKHGFVCVKNDDDVRFLKSLLEPYFIAYYICLDFLLAKQAEMSEAEYVRNVQDGIIMKFDQQYSEEQTDQYRSPRWLQILSIDTLKNCLHNLVHLGAVGKMRGKNPTFSPNLSKLNNIKERLSPYFDNLYETEKEADVKIKAKL